MARPDRLRLDEERLPWRPAPMPGANRRLELVRLASSGDTFAILGRFPAGFERPVRGGYGVAEEFVVLTGALELEGTVVQRGALCSIPAHHPRAPMRSPAGCTVLAWFGGAPVFHPAEELTPVPSSAVATARVRPFAAGTRLLRTTEADWTIADLARLPAQEPPVDVIDLGLTWWALVGAGVPSGILPGPALVRFPPATRPAAAASP